MLRWFRRRPALSRDALLNEGLALAMDWGEDWLAPIHARLHARHPDLDAVTLDACDATCRAAMHLGHETVYAALQSGGDAPSLEAFASTVRATHPWVDDANLARLLHQSIYYAAKTGAYAREP